MLSLQHLFLLLVGLTGLVRAKSSSGDSVLVVVEPSKQDDYSVFFTDLRERGYDLTFRAPKADSPPLIEFDVPSFSHIVLLASETKHFAKAITPQSLVSLLPLGTNLMVFLSTKQTVLSSLAAEFSLMLPPPGSPLVSYFPARDEPATVIPITPDANPKTAILSSHTKPIYFSGVPFSLGNNPLLVPILKAPPQAFASDVDGGSHNALADAAEKGGEGLWAGSQLNVIAGFQTRSNARVTFIGSAEMFGDEFMGKQVAGGESGNRQLAKDVSAWAFQESLVLRIDKTEHHLVNATEPKTAYTTNDNIVYSAYISAYNPATNSWKPYSGITDLQLEFTMLDPHVRTAIPPVPGHPGKYSVTFRAPDRHGVYKFVIDHRRKGWTHLHSSTTVPVVPPRHDGYPRFLSAAWPYYTGAISTSVAFFLFSAIWLAGEIREGKKGKGSKTE